MPILNPSAHAASLARRRLFLSAFLLCLAALPLRAQGISLLQAGTRIRVTSSRSGSDPLVGSVLRLVRDTLVMATVGGSALLTLTTSQLTRLEVSDGRDRATWGFGGALAGAAALGLGTGIALKGQDPSGLASFVGFIAGGVVGFFLGAVGGALAAPEQWRPFTPPASAPSAP